LVALVVLGVVGGCTAGDREAQPISPPSDASRAAARALTAPQQARPDEAVMGRRAGSGPARAALTGTTQEVVYLYGVCAGGTEVAVRLVARVRPELVVPCDGGVSRMQVYSESGQDFRVEVVAADDQRWTLLVTASAESGRR
jgi:hypothetical protein